MDANADATNSDPDPDAHTYAHPAAPSIVAVDPLVLRIPVTRNPGISITAVHVGGAAGVIALISDGDGKLSLRSQRQTNGASEQQGE